MPDTTGHDLPLPRHACSDPALACSAAMREPPGASCQLRAALPGRVPSAGGRDARADHVPEGGAPGHQGAAPHHRRARTRLRRRRDGRAQPAAVGESSGKVKGERGRGGEGGEEGKRRGEKRRGEERRGEERRGEGREREREEDG